LIEFTPPSYIHIIYATTKIQWFHGVDVGKADPAPQNNVSSTYEKQHDINSNDHGRCEKKKSEREVSQSKRPDKSIVSGRNESVEIMNGRLCWGAPVEELIHDSWPLDIVRLG